jgi:ABC-2 type transport system permease protein
VREAGFFLIVCSTRNWTRGVFRQLRSPRYAIAVLLGIGYIALVRLGQTQGGGGVPSGAVILGGSLFLAILFAKWWVFGADRLALAFTPAEIQILFPAPVSRAALLGLKLVRAQKLILVNVLVWTFLLRRSGGSHLGILSYGISMWVFFSTLFFHRLGVALVRDSMTTHGRAGVRRAWPAVLFLFLLGAAVWFTLERLPPQSLSLHPGGALGGLGLLVETAPLRWVLVPFRIPLLPLGAENLGDWLVRLLPALLLLLGHLVWIVRSDRSFEEAAIEASVRREEFLERWKRHGPAAGQTPSAARSWVPLQPSGHPSLAIVWKNLTRLVRSTSPAFIIALLVAIGVGAFVSITGPERPAWLTLIATLSFGWTAALALFGPLWIRIDIRGELNLLPVLRTWPLSGMALMTGQVLSSTIVLTALQLLLGGTGLLALVLAHSREFALPGLQLAVLGVVGLLVVGGVNLVALCIQNGAALLFPSWVRTEIHPGGIEQMGQHLLTAGISLVLLLAAAAGPAMLGAGATYLLRPSIEWWALVPGGLLTAAGLGLESFLFLDWLGGRFERLDPSSIQA